jgi:hypothetical protein
MSLARHFFVDNPNHASSAASWALAAVMSMIKRRLEAFVRGRSAWSQRRELRLKVLTHNIMILLRIEVFY